MPDLRTWRGLAPTAPAEDLPGFLDNDGNVLLQFLIDDHDVVILLSARQPGESGVALKAFVRPVKRQDLARRIVRAMDGNALASIEAWHATSRDVFAILPGEIVDQLSTAKSVTVIPDDTLWRIPFEAMPIRDRYLADRTSVTYATSLTAAVKPPPVARSAAAPRVVAVAAAMLATGVVEDLKTTVPTWSLRSAEAAGLEAAAFELSADKKAANRSSSVVLAQPRQLP